MDVESKLKVLFFQNSSPDEIYSIIKEFSNQPKANFISTIDCLMDAELDVPRKEKAILACEELFLLKNFSFLRKYLFLLYDSIGNEPMARYFLDICNEDDPDSLNEMRDKVKKYENKLIDSIKFSYYKNNFSNQYKYNDKEKSYSIFSYSNEIGNNMTLIKTPYGALIFDCGAKCSIDGTIQISCSDINDFLFATDTTIDDVKGCFISHAHLDHYGSINSIIDAGLPKNKIFVGKMTRDLILNSTQDSLKLDDALSPENFFVANNSIKVYPIQNGHILGSQAFLVSFDNINILFTGDFCIHDQLTVNGLNVKNILSIDSVKKYGIDCLITETTYGHSIHYLDHDSSIYALIHFTDVLLNLDYKVFFPSFAIGRSQEIACMLNTNFSILLDGLSVKISKLYEALSENKIFNENTRFNVETDKMYNFDLNKIIIASSGMITKGSTSYKYMEELLKSKDNVAVFKTGFISSESAGNDLLDEWKTKDNVFVDTPLSAHASYDEIIGLINEINPKNVVSIHGDGLLLHEVEDTTLYDVKIEKNETFSIFDNEETKIQIEENEEEKTSEAKNPESDIENEFSNKTVESISDNNITIDDFLDAKRRLDILYHSNQGKGYRPFMDAIEGNKIFSTASFEYVHKRDVTPQKPKGLYVSIPVLDFKKYGEHSVEILQEVYELICKVCDGDNKIPASTVVEKEQIVEKKDEQSSPFNFTYKDIEDAKQSIDKFNRKTNYSKSIKDLIKYVGNNPIFQGINFHVVTKAQQTKDKPRGLYVDIPALNLSLHDEMAGNVVNSIISIIKDMYESAQNNKTEDNNVSTINQNEIETPKETTLDNAVDKLLSSIGFDDLKDDNCTNQDLEGDGKNKKTENDVSLNMICDSDGKEKVQISDLYLKSKIDNVIKCAKSLLENNIALENSPSFISAIKLLIKFLKMHIEHKELVDMLSQFGTDYLSMYDVILFIKDNDYCYFK